MRLSNYKLITGLLAGIITIPLVVVAYQKSTIYVQTDAVVSTDIKSEQRGIEVKTITREEPTSLGEFRITAYCACEKCCGAWADGITYTGTVATEGRTIAVDPEVIPLGSVVDINGAEYVAEDIGGAINGDRVDLYFNSHDDALEWGVQYHDIFLIKFPQFRE